MELRWVPMALMMEMSLAKRAMAASAIPLVMADLQELWVADQAELAAHAEVNMANTAKIIKIN
jgi:hypothetical protein